MAVTAMALPLAACSDDGGDSIEAGGPTTTTLPDDAYSTVALSRAAAEFGRAMIDRDAERAHELMTQRCRDQTTAEGVGAILNLIVSVTERLQEVESEEMRVVGAFVGEMEDGRGEAAIRLNEQAFKDPEFAILQMQNYVFEDGVWRYDSCDAMIRSDDGEPVDVEDVVDVDAADAADAADADGAEAEDEDDSRTSGL